MQVKQAHKHASRAEEPQQGTLAKGPCSRFSQENTAQPDADATRYSASAACRSMSSAACTECEIKHDTHRATHACFWLHVCLRILTPYGMQLLAQRRSVYRRDTEVRQEEPASTTGVPESLQISSNTLARKEQASFMPDGILQSQVSATQSHCARFGQASSSLTF